MPSKFTLVHSKQLTLSRVLKIRLRNILLPLLILLFARKQALYEFKFVLVGLFILKLCFLTKPGLSINKLSIQPKVIRWFLEC